MPLASEHDPGVGLEILSPHLDDAVYSCWGAIGPATRVTTIFAGYPEDEAPSAWDVSTGFTNSRASMLTRQGENDDALMRTRTLISNLNFLDAQYRTEPLEPTDIFSLIEQLLDKGTPVLAPLGFSHSYWHPDHVLTREVAKMLQQNGHDVSYYADIPYCVPPDALDEWPNRLPEHSLRALLASEVSLEVVELSKEQQTAKKSAVQAYASQFDRNNDLAGGIFSDPRAYMQEVIVKTV